MRNRFVQRYISIVILTVFLWGSIVPSPSIYAQIAPSMGLSAVQRIPSLAQSFTPTIMAGLEFNFKNPLQLNFILDVGDNHLQGEELRRESEKLVQYFMAALTVPEDQMWVNLSPTEKDRIIADGLGRTALGRDMLAMDLELKKVAAGLMGSLLEKKAGSKKEEERSKSNEVGQLNKNDFENLLSTISSRFTLPSSDFLSKIWIVPDKAVVFVKGNNVFVAESHLKVKFQDDFLAIRNKLQAVSEVKIAHQDTAYNLLLTTIEQEINTSTQFAPLRQIYHAMILATWYKKNLKASVRANNPTSLQFYLDQNLTNGIDLADKNIKNKIYNQYLAAFQQGVSQSVKEEYDPETQAIVSKKYLTGGEDFAMMSRTTSQARGELSPTSWLFRSGSIKARVTAGIELNKSGDQQGVPGNNIDSALIAKIEKDFDKKLAPILGRSYRSIEEYYGAYIRELGVREDLVREMKAVDKETAVIIFFKGLPLAKELFGEQWVAQWPQFLELIKVAGKNKHGFSNLRDLFESLPDLKRKFDKDWMVYWPVLVDLCQVAGSDEVMFINSGVDLLRKIAHTPEEMRNLGLELIQIGNISKSKEWGHEWAFYYNLKRLSKVIKNKDDLIRVAKELAEFLEILNQDAKYFYSSLEALNNTFGDELAVYWPDLVALGRLSKNNVGRLFQFGFAQLKRSLGEDWLKYWPEFNKLGKKSDYDVYNLLGFGLPAIRGLINSPADVENLGNELLRVHNKLKHPNFVFYRLPLFSHLIQTQDQIEIIATDLDIIADAAGDRVDDVFRHGLYQLRGLIKTRKALKKVGQDLINISKVCSLSSLFLENQSPEFPKFKKAFGNKWKMYWPVVVQLMMKAGGEGDLAEDILGDGLPAVTQLIKNKNDLKEVGEDLIEIGKKSGGMVFYALPAMAEMINTRDELKKIGQQLNEIYNLVPINKEYSSWHFDLFYDTFNKLKKLFGEKWPEYWPVIFEFAKKSEKNVAVFIWSLENFVEYITNTDELGIVGDALVEICNKAGDDAQAIIFGGLVHLKKGSFNHNDISKIGNDLLALFNASGIREKYKKSDDSTSSQEYFKNMIEGLVRAFGGKFKDYLPELIEAGKEAGTNAFWLMNEALPKVRSLIKGPEDIKRVSRQLVELRDFAKMENTDMFVMILGNAFGSNWIDYWPDIVELVKKSRSATVLANILNEFNYRIHNREDLLAIGNEVAEISQAVSGKGSIDSILSVYNLLNRFKINKDEILSDVSQTSEAILKEDGESHSIDEDHWGAIFYLRIINTYIYKELFGKYLTDRGNLEILNDVLTQINKLSIGQILLLREFYATTGQKYSSSKTGFSNVDFFISLIGAMNAYKTLGIPRYLFKKDLNTDTSSPEMIMANLGKRIFRWTARRFNVSLSTKGLSRQRRNFAEVMKVWDMRYLGLLISTSEDWPEDKQEMFQLLLRSAIQGTDKGLTDPKMYDKYPIEVYGKENKNLVTRIRRHNLNILRLMEARDLKTNVWLDPNRYVAPRKTVGEGKRRTSSEILIDFKKRWENFKVWVDRDLPLGIDRNSLNFGIIERGMNGWGKIKVESPDGNLFAQKERLNELRALVNQLSSLIPLNAKREAFDDLTIILREIDAFDRARPVHREGWMWFWKRDIGKDSFAGNCAGSCTALDSNATAIFEFELDVGTQYLFISDEAFGKIRGYIRFWIGLDYENKPTLFFDSTDGTLANQYEEEMLAHISDFAKELGIDMKEWESRSDNIDSKLGGALTKNYFHHSSLEITKSKPRRAVDQWKPKADIQAEVSDHAMMVGTARDRSGVGFIRGKLNGRVKVNRKEILAKLTQSNNNFTEAQRELLAEALVRIRKGSMEDRPEIFTEYLIGQVLVDADLDLNDFIERIKVEEVKYRQTQPNIKPFSDKEIEFLLFKKLIPYSWIQYFVDEGLSKSTIMFILNWWSDPKQKWERDFRNLINELVDNGLERYTAIELVIKLKNPKEKWQALKPMRDELVALGAEPNVATYIVVGWKHPKEKYQAVEDVLDFIRQKLNVESKTARWYLLQNSYQRVVSDLLAKNISRDEIDGGIKPLKEFEEKWNGGDQQGVSGMKDDQQGVPGKRGDQQGVPGMRGPDPDSAMTAEVPISIPMSSDLLAPYLIANEQELSRAIGIEDLRSIEDSFHTPQPIVDLVKASNMDDATSMFRGMRLYDGDLMGILSAGMRPSSYHNESRFSSAENASAYSFQPDTETNYPRQDFISVVFEVAKPENDNFTVLGTILPQEFKRVWVFDVKQKKFIVLYQRPTKETFETNPKSDLAMTSKEDESSINQSSINLPEAVFVPIVLEKVYGPTGEISSDSPEAKDMIERDIKRGFFKRAPDGTLQAKALRDPTKEPNPRTMHQRTMFSLLTPEEIEKGNQTRVIKGAGLPESKLYAVVKDNQLHGGLLRGNADTSIDRAFRFQQVYQEAIEGKDPVVLIARNKYGITSAPTIRPLYQLKPTKIPIKTDSGLDYVDLKDYPGFNNQIEKDQILFIYDVPLNQRVNSVFDHVTGSLRRDYDPVDIEQVYAFYGTRDRKKILEVFSAKLALMNHLAHKYFNLLFSNPRNHGMTGKDTTYSGHVLDLEGMGAPPIENKDIFMHEDYDGVKNTIKEFSRRVLQIESEAGLKAYLDVRFGGVLPEDVDSDFLNLILNEYDSPAFGNIFVATKNQIIKMLNKGFSADEISKELLEHFEDIKQSVEDGEDSLSPSESEIYRILQKNIMTLILIVTTDNSVSSIKDKTDINTTKEALPPTDSAMTADSPQFVGKVTLPITERSRSEVIDPPVEKYLGQLRLPEGQLATIVDFGVGFPPITTMRTARILQGKARIIGVDLNIPEYVVRFSDDDGVKYTAFFERNSKGEEVLSYVVQNGQAMGVLGFDYYDIPNHAKQMSISQLAILNRIEFRQAKEENDVKALMQMEEAGEGITPYSVFVQSPNLEFRKSGFEMSAVTEPVDVIRVSNVFGYYTAEEVKEALALMAEKLKEGGALFVFRNEEFKMTYIKENGRLRIKEIGIKTLSPEVMERMAVLFPELKKILQYEFSGTVLEKTTELMRNPLSSWFTQARIIRDALNQQGFTVVMDEQEFIVFDMETEKVKALYDQQGVPGKRGDSAMTAKETDKELGGIDLNASKMEMKEEGDTFHFDLPQGEPGTIPVKVNRVAPYIIKITPIPDFPQWLGQIERKEGTALSRL